MRPAAGALQTYLAEVSQGGKPAASAAEIRYRREVREGSFTTMLATALGDGVDGVALVDHAGATVAVAGALSTDEARPLAALAVHRLKSRDLAARLFAGEILSLRLDGRDVAIGVAKRQLFVVAVLESSTPTTLARVGDLRDAVGRKLMTEFADAATWTRGNGGSGSGPAESPLVEIGVTVRRERVKS